MVTSPSKIADIQNEFYINKVRKTRQELPHSNTDPLEILKHRLSGNTASFSFSAVHPDEVEKIISSLKNSKACGIDHLDTYILKLIKKEAVPAICHILNLSIQTTRFPTRWKVAKVVPLYKGKGSKFESKNYRPVAILPVLSKVLERVVFIQLVRYMDQNRFFNPSHHGYRSFHSTTTAMLQMYDMWVTSLEKGELAGVVMVDMSAAFDVVDTELLLQKLRLYGLDQNSVQWAWSYLTYRSQGVCIEGSLSGLLALEAGVPQGSILGPLFYTIFTNELPQVVHEADCPLKDLEGADIFSINCTECGGLCCYADDSTYTLSGKDPAQLTQKLGEKYSILADYLAANKLKVNDEKTHLLVMTTRQRRRFMDTRSMSMITPTATITASPVEKLLGAYIHEDMKWTEHIMANDDSLIKSLNKRQAAIKKISLFASFKARKSLANGIFMSKLIYLMPLWAGCDDNLVKALQVLQNKVARSVTKKNRFTPTKTLMKECGWLTVKQLMIYHSLVQLHKTIQSKKPEYLHKRVTKELDQLEERRHYYYKTRQYTSGALRQIPELEAKLDISQRSWCWRATSVYYSLPMSIQRQPKLTTFKTKLRTWVKETIETI